jgi:hypothetical protein
MKIKSLLAGFLVAGFAAAASAQTYVHIVGSTAFRAGVQQSIVDALTNSGGTAPTGVYWGSSTYKKCSGAAVSGTYNGQWVIVETYWTGSLSGDVDLSVGNQVTKFISFNNNGGPALTSGSLAYIASGQVYESGTTPDAAMSDSDYQSVSDELKDANSTLTGYTSGAALASAVNNAGLVDSGSNASAAGCVAVVPFRWILGVAGSQGEVASNITQQAARDLATKGFVQFSELSGSTSDTTNFALLVGRNEDSGTRIDSLAESQAEGTTYDFPPIQVLANFNNNATTESALTSGDNGYLTGGVGSSIGSLTKFPANNTLNTEPLINWSAYGHSGYVSGGDVANVLSSSNNVLLSGTSLGSGNTAILSSGKSAFFTAGTSHVSVIGYVGISDAATAIGNGAIALSYNGVPYSATAVENGQYTVWGYEHMYYLFTATPGTGGTVQTTLDGIADTIYASDADIDASDTSHGGGSSGGILYGSMNVKRTPLEGGIVSPNK